MGFLFEFVLMTVMFMFVYGLVISMVASIEFSKKGFDFAFKFFTILIGVAYLLVMFSIIRSYI